MTRTEFDTLCSEQPAATLSGPGELDAWKVVGKMFACFGHVDTRADNTENVTVRCPDVETTQMLIDTGIGTKPPYFRGAWVQLHMPSLDHGEARHRIAVSYDTIRSGLTKKAQSALPTREEAI